MRVKSGRARRGSTPGGGAERTADDLPRAESVVDGRWLVAGKDGRLTAYARTEGGLTVA